MTAPPAASRPAICADTLDSRVNALMDAASVLYLAAVGAESYRDDWAGSAVLHQAGIVHDHAEALRATVAGVAPRWGVG